MARKRNVFLGYVLKLRGTPFANRRRVGQSLIFLTVGIFCILLVNFAVIIGTDSKFGQDLSKGAESVHQTTVTVFANRGTIYDRTGMPIAEDSTTYTIYAVIDTDYVSATDEKLYVDESQFNQVAELLHKHLGMETDYVLTQLKQTGLYQVSFGSLGKNISYSTMCDITEEADSLKIKGLGFTSSPGRMYPNGNFATLFVGLAQLVEDEETGTQSFTGKTGLELYLNDILSGQDGQIVYEKDSQGRILPGTGKAVTSPVDGQDVYTTISSDLQRSLESNMDVFYGETGGENATATLVSAKTGEILATTQRPSFDADTLEGLDDDFNWQSLLYQGNFEPGSTMKVVTLASMIDAGLFNPNEYYTNTGYTIADATINDWTVNDGKDPVTLTFAQGFSLSSNVGMTTLQQRMGDDAWLNYLTKFRFGYPTRFGMGDEDSGLFPSDNIVSIAMSSFGQGISATPVQMLRSFSAIANDGVMLEPKFITALYDPNTETARFAEKEEVGKPVSATAAQETRNYMINVGTDPIYGTLYSSSVGGAIIQVDGYNIAVKSGTAQIASEDGSGYIDGANLNSVVAMIPAENPEFIMYVTVKRPDSFSAVFWQDIVNPVLKEAMNLKDSLNLTNPAPALSDVTTETAYTLEDVIGQSPGETAEKLRRYLVQPIILGNGTKIEKISVDTGSNLAANQQILLLSDDFTTMPDFYGWTKENTEVFAEWTGLDITYTGDGTKVVDQSVAVGENLENTTKLTITLGE